MGALLALFRKPATREVEMSEVPREKEAPEELQGVDMSAWLRMAESVVYYDEGDDFWAHDDGQDMHAVAVEIGGEGRDR
jgi:hypothetical protein